MKIEITLDSDEEKLTVDIDFQKRTWQIGKGPHTRIAKSKTGNVQIILSPLQATSCVGSGDTIQFYFETLGASTSSGTKGAGGSEARAETFKWKVISS